MREIKFRAWDAQHQQYLYFTPWDEMGQEQYVEWEQFTGLKDSVGKEIYEGDIICQSDGKYREVCFKSGSFGKGVDFDFHQIWGDDTVIGNIYENPELLKP
jgi:hypothetical protein